MPQNNILLTKIIIFFTNVYRFFEWCRKVIKYYFRETVFKFFIILSILSTAFFVTMWMNKSTSFVNLFFDIANINIKDMVVYTIIGLAIAILFQIYRTKAQIIFFTSLIKWNSQTTKEKKKKIHFVNLFFNLFLVFSFTAILISIIVFQTKEVNSRVVKNELKIANKEYWSNKKVLKNLRWIKKHPQTKYKTSRANKRKINKQIKLQIWKKKKTEVKEKSIKILIFSIVLEIFALVGFLMDVWNFFSGTSETRNNIARKYRKLSKEENEVGIPLLTWKKNIENQYENKTNQKRYKKTKTGLIKKDRF